MMRHSPLGLLALVWCAAAPSLRAQSLVADTSAFRALDLPSPSEYRTGSGRPGPKYWQQQADYRIAATLDPVLNEVRGEATLHYQNRSPEALPYLWLFVEQNACLPTSVTARLDQPPLVFGEGVFQFSCRLEGGGLRLSRVASLGKALRHTLYGTTMRIDLPVPLKPGLAIDLEFSWSFKVPSDGMGRMGRDGSLYQIAQWYPRMAVFDDVRGWNHEPYIGSGEFYLEYGRFDVSLTVPATYVVAATGQLVNPLQVLTAAQRARLAAARRADTTVAIITAAEAGDPARTRPATAGMLTWHFTADSVRDFAFAAAPGLRWDASGYKGVLIESLYRPGARGWEEANRMARGAIRYFSEQWYPYPWSHATTVEGPVGGMEYPMLTFCPASDSQEEVQWVIAHEFGHQWFPMIVGSNERLYPWMDEGFNTFIDLANAAGYFAGTPYGDTIEVHSLHLYPAHALAGAEQPLSSKPVEVRDLFWTAYEKPALMMQLLRYEVLGKDRFDPAFREYIRTWAYRHPTPADFFRIMRDESGMDLDWFWRGWVYTTARLDQAVDSVGRGEAGVINVYLSNRGQMVMPAELELTYGNGDVERVALPVDMWNLGSAFTHRVTGHRAVRRAVLDPRQALPDVDRKNNSWESR